MEEKTKKKIERNKKIITHNRKVVYSLNRKKKQYPYLNKLFTGEVRKLYLKVMKFIVGKNTNNENFRIKIHLSTSQIIDLRKKGSESTANHYINFLCAMGFLRKIPQDRLPDKLKKYGFEPRLTKTNRTFLKKKKLECPENPYFEPINVFEIFKLTDERLAKIEQRCRVLDEHKITKGNVSKVTLEARGLYNIAEEVLETTVSKYPKRLEQYQQIKAFLMHEIDGKGYATMKDIYDNVIIVSDRERNESVIKKVLSQLREDFNKDFKYSAPTADEKERYGLQFNFWIIRKRYEK